MVSYTPKILPDLPVGRVPPSPAGLGQQAVAMSNVQIVMPPKMSEPSRACGGIRAGPCY